ncbi:conserved protein, unknown function, partial [Hepatocystis sp. ex Piliocolobus tephrosceles]
MRILNNTNNHVNKKKKLSSKKNNKEKVGQMKENVKSTSQSNTSDGLSLGDVLKELGYYEHNSSNIKLLTNLKNVIIDFIKYVEKDIYDVAIVKYKKKKKMLEYLQCIQLKKYTTIGSYEKKMYINKYINIDIGIEYDLFNYVIEKKGKI